MQTSDDGGLGWYITGRDHKTMVHNNSIFHDMQLGIFLFWAMNTFLFCNY